MTADTHRRLTLRLLRRLHRHWAREGHAGLDALLRHLTERLEREIQKPVSRPEMRGRRDGR